MKEYRDITWENPNQQLWKLLRGFLEVDAVSKRIREIHGITDKKSRADINKQALQIGYCIRQAQEYFQASANVSLATRPLMIYYGVTSLSTALVLFRQDGSYSLDALRKNHKHQHHGLLLSRGSLQSVTNAHGVNDVLSVVDCNIKHLDGIPWGLFGLFFKSLIPCDFAIENEIRDVGKSMLLKTFALHPCADTVKIDDLAETSFKAIELIKSLPDTFSMLSDLGIGSYLIRGSVHQETIRSYKKDMGIEQPEQIVERFNFFIDGISSEYKEAFIRNCKTRNENIKVASDLGSNIHLNLSLELNPSSEASAYFIPDIFDDLNGKLYYPIPTKTYLPEPASLFILSFCLGMFSRYFPDLWMRLIDQDVQAAEAIDSLLNIIVRKFPNLILDQMTEVKHHIHI